MDYLDELDDYAMQTLVELSGGINMPSIAHTAANRNTFPS